MARKKDKGERNRKAHPSVSPPKQSSKPKKDKRILPLLIHGEMWDIG